MTPDAARNYFQEKYQTAVVTDSITPGKAIKGKCPNKVKFVALGSENDSLNYAFGYLNGDEIARYILLMDSTGQMTKDFIRNINKSLKSSIKNPTTARKGLKSINAQITPKTLKMVCDIAALFA